MTEGSLEDWLRSRSPEVPEPFLPHLLRDKAWAGDSRDLAARGEAALHRALETPGRERSAAFHLLVADAFLTWACEVVAREGDVGAGLEALLKKLGEHLA